MSIKEKYRLRIQELQDNIVVEQQEIRRLKYLVDKLETAEKYTEGAERHRRLNTLTAPKLLHSDGSLIV